MCELPDYSLGLSDALEALEEHVRKERSDVVVLPEMPFVPWLASSDQFDEHSWRDALTADVAGLETLERLGAAYVISSKLTESVVGRRTNDAFTWSREGGLHAGHSKTKLPQETGYWEKTWFTPGEQMPGLREMAGLRCGTLLCTELWYADFALRLGRGGAHLIGVPRATTAVWADRWTLAGRFAAVASGGFVASSNRSGPTDSGPVFGGGGWVIDPSGDVLAETSASHPVVTVEIRLAEAERAKASYPRYVWQAPSGGPRL